MDQYDIIYKGEIMPTLAVEQVRNNLAALFKTSAEKLDKLFDGEPQTLKSGLTRDQADQYRNALKKAGAIVYLRRHGAKTAPPETAISSGLSIAAQSGYLLRENERQAVTPLSINTDHIELSPPGNQLIVSVPDPSPPPTTDHLSLARPGSDLEPLPRTPGKPPSVNLEGMSLSPQGPLLQRHERASPKRPPPLSLKLSLVPQSQPAGES